MSFPDISTKHCQYVIGCLGLLDLLNKIVIMEQIFKKTTLSLPEPSRVRGRRGTMIQADLLDEEVAPQEDRERPE